MPLKPIFDKAPLTVMNAHPLRAGLVRSDSVVMAKVYGMIANASSPLALEGAFRLACVVCTTPGEEPCAAKIRALLATQNKDGSFAMTFKESIAVLRAAWVLYEYEARKPILEHIGRWCADAAKNWDALMADDDVWTSPADLLELLENLYRVTGKAAVLSLCENVTAQTMNWAGVLNTISSQRPTSKAVSNAEIDAGLAREQGGRDGYYAHFLRTNHAESLADGARSTMAKGWFSGSATELHAAQNGWEKLYRHHGAVCGGLTSDELLEGTSPAAGISTAALGAWAEALASAAMGDDASWAYAALERMVFNAMPACVQGDQLLPIQHVNTLTADAELSGCFRVQNDHAERSLIRLARGYAAVASAAVAARPDGAAVNMYLPGRYAVPVEDEVIVLAMGAAGKAMSIKLHCKKELKAALRLRMPEWSRNTEVLVNGADHHLEVKNGMMTIERTWHDGDEITLAFDHSLIVVEGHHQGKAVLRGPVLMAMPAEDAWRQAFAAVTTRENHVICTLEGIEEWKAAGNIPADIPVLPQNNGVQREVVLTPYAKTPARISLFPGRKQA